MTDAEYLGWTPDTDSDSDTQCNSQITDGVTQTSVHVLGLGPATAENNAYLGQAHSTSILFSNSVNQQAQYANLAQATLTQELAQLLALSGQL